MKITFVNNCDGWDNAKKLKNYISIAVPFEK